MMKDINEVATHVLIPMAIADKLRELAKRTRVRQSEYLREAVQDLLKKYEEHEHEKNPDAADGGAGA